LIEIGEARLQVEKYTWADAADLESAMRAAAAGAAEPDTRAHLELLRLLALARACEAIGIDAPPPRIREWLNARRSDLVFSEPAGQWLVMSELFWKLAEGYPTAPVGDRVAWAAARNHLPGECEGWPPCWVRSSVLTDGRYLELRPMGAHVAEAVVSIEELLDASLSDEAALGDSLDPEDAAQLGEDLRRLQRAVESCGASDSTRLRGKFDAVRQRYAPGRRPQW
jgi:hypothetical protein